MANILIEYLRHKYWESADEAESTGPVITISRAYGCPAVEVAQELVARISAEYPQSPDILPWHWLSKEILQASAYELDIDPSRVEEVAAEEGRNIVKDILMSVASPEAVSDARIRATIAHMIESVARAGNVVLVGLGGVAITRQLRRSLHIRLQACVDWRARRLKEQNSYSIVEARRVAQEQEIRRSEFRKRLGGGVDAHAHFDMYLNCEKFTVSEIVDLVFKAAQIRGVIS